MFEIPEEENFWEELPLEDVTDVVTGGGNIHQGVVVPVSLKLKDPSQDEKLTYKRRKLETADVSKNMIISSPNENYGRTDETLPSACHPVLVPNTQPSSSHHQHPSEGHIPISNTPKTYSKSISSTLKGSKRKFPGPAGLLPKLGAQSSPARAEIIKSPNVHPENQRDEVLTSSQSEDSFNDLPWNTLIKELGNDGEKYLSKFSIASNLLKSKKKLLPSGKVPLVMAVVETIDWQGSEASVLLKDKSGKVNGTIHGDIMKEYQEDIQVNSVLVIRQAGVISPTARNQYLNITPSNIVTIYSRKEEGVKKVCCVGQNVCSVVESIHNDIGRDHLGSTDSGNNIHRTPSKPETIVSSNRGIQTPNLNQHSAPDYRFRSRSCINQITKSGTPSCNKNYSVVGTTPQHIGQITRTGAQQCSNQISRTGTPQSNNQFARTGTPQYNNHINRTGTPQYSNQFTRTGTPQCINQIARTGTPQCNNQIARTGTPQCNDQIPRTGTPHCNDQINITPYKQNVHVKGTVSGNSDSRTPTAFMDKLPTTNTRPPYVPANSDSITRNSFNSATTLTDSAKLLENNVMSTSCGNVICDDGNTDIGSNHNPSRTASVCAKPFTTPNRNTGIGSNHNTTGTASVCARPFTTPVRDTGIGSNHNTTGTASVCARPLSTPNRDTGIGSNHSTSGTASMCARPFTTPVKDTGIGSYHNTTGTASVNGRPVNTPVRNGFRFKSTRKSPNATPGSNSNKGRVIQSKTEQKQTAVESNTHINGSFVNEQSSRFNCDSTYSTDKLSDSHNKPDTGSSHKEGSEMSPDILMKNTDLCAKNGADMKNTDSNTKNRPFIVDSNWTDDLSDDLLSQLSEEMLEY